MNPTTIDEFNEQLRLMDVVREGNAKTINDARFLKHHRNINIKKVKMK